MACGDSMSSGGAAQAGPVGGDQEGRHAARARARCRTGEDGVEVGLGGVGDPALLARQAPTPVVLGRR